MALIASGFQTTDDVQLWVQVSCAIAMAIGTVLVVGKSSKLSVVKS